MLLGEQADDDARGGTCPQANPDPRLPCGQRPQELELNVAAAIKRELRSRLSIRNTEACLINSAVVGELYQDITARTCCSAKALYVRQGYLSVAAMWHSGTLSFSHCPIWVVYFVRFKILTLLSLKTLWSSQSRFKCVPWSH